MIVCGPRQRGTPAFFLPLAVCFCHVSCVCTYCFCSSVVSQIRVKAKLYGSHDWFSAELVPAQVNRKSLRMRGWGSGAKRAGLPLHMSACA